MESSCFSVGLHMCAYCLGMSVCLHDYAPTMKTLLYKSLQEETATGSASDLESLHCTCPLTALYRLVHRVQFVFQFIDCTTNSSTSSWHGHIQNWTLQMIACYDAIIAIVPWTTYWLRFKTLWLVNTPLSPFHCAHISSPCSSWLYKLPIDNGMCVCTAVSKSGTLIE